MKKSKFTEQQIAFILKQADGGVSVEDTRRKARIWDPDARSQAPEVRVG